MERVFFIIIALTLSCLVGVLGEKRKIGFGWSFALSLFFTPIIGLIITLFSRKKDSVDFVDINKKENL